VPIHLAWLFRSSVAYRYVPSSLPTNPTPLSDGTLFVAPDGTGTDCTEANPCDLWTAAEIVQPTDVVFLRGGTYDIDHTLNLDQSGTEDASILFESYPGEHAILDGSSNTLGDDVFIRLRGWYVQIRRGGGRDLFVRHVLSQRNQ